MPQALNFESLLIITYGRSGSTLLQGVVNSIDGVLVRGENCNMCFHLFKTHQAILEAKTHYGGKKHNPFYGSQQLDEDYFLEQTRETVKNLLLADHKHDPSVRCFGFKEIRYWENLQDLPEFLDFLQKIFPQPCFIFNTRNKHEVLNSWLNLNWLDRDECTEMLEVFEQTESAFRTFKEKHPANTFHISYEDIIAKTEKLLALYTFLGANYEEEKLDRLLSRKHSYRPNQKWVKKLKGA